RNARSDSARRSRNDERPAETGRSSFLKAIANDAVIRALVLPPRARRPFAPLPARRVTRALIPTALEPMYATIGTDVPSGTGWTFEPKYDGMRALAFVHPTRVQLMTRNGKDKAQQFPEVVDALRALARRINRP